MKIEGQPVTWLQVTFQLIRHFLASAGGLGEFGRIWLKSIINPCGNGFILNYDASRRLTAVLDSIDQVSPSPDAVASDTSR